MSHDSNDFWDCSCAECALRREITQEPKVIDITPTWQSLIRALVLLATQGETAEARETAWQELDRLAKIADELIAQRRVKARIDAPLCLTCGASMERRRPPAASIRGIENAKRVWCCPICDKR